MAQMCLFHTPPLDSVAVSAVVASTLQHASSLDEISHYYVLPEMQGELDFIVFDVPESMLPQDPEIHSLEKVVYYKQFSQSGHPENPIIYVPGYQSHPLGP